MSVIGDIFTINHNIQRRASFGLIFCCRILHHVYS